MGPPDPQSRKTPPSNKKESPKIQKSSRIPYFPKVDAISPKVNAISPKVNAISPKPNVKYFKGIFEEFKVFEIFCWGVAVIGVSKISNV